MAAVCAAMAAACSDPAAGQDGAAAGTASEVIIAVPQLSSPGLSTRVSLVDDSDNAAAGQSVSLCWTENDDFSLWAIGGDNAGECKNMRFAYWGGDRYPAGGNILFSSSEVPVMSEGEYSYRAFYPYTDDVDRENNRINYEISSVQNGRYDGRCDIMSAEAVRSTALVRDWYNQSLDLVFRHQTHMLKITVPESSNMFGYDITRIRIEFPQPVAGRLSFDAATGEVLTDGIVNNIIDVQFDEPLVPGEPFWVFIAPTEISGEVKFSAYGGEDEIYMNDPSIAPEGAFTTLAKGHITPVKLGLKGGFSVTWFNYEILDESSRLGESLQSLNLTLPSGLHTADRSDSEGVVKVAKDGENLYRVAFRTQELAAALSEPINFQPRYESAHALLSPYAADLDKFVVASGSYVPNRQNAYTIECVPYIFEEDFSGVSSFSSGGDNPTGSFSTTTTAESLAEFNLPGWSAARGGGEAGKAVRICGRTEDGVLSIAHYHGRLDSPALSNIKEGVTAKVSVSFNYSLGRNNSIGHTPCFAYGSHTTQGVINSKGTTRGDATPGLTDPVAKDLTGNLDGSYDNITEYASYEIPVCTSGHRLAWEIYTSGRQIGNSNSWLYIDNVKVSIVTE